jgi:hypothetical protein
MKKAITSLTGFQSAVNKISGGVKGDLARMMAGVGAGFAIKQGTEDAIKYEALMGTLNESMGNSIGKFQEWQNETGGAMGFGKLEGAKLANTLSLNFKKISSSTEDLVGRTTKMMETAAIISNKRGMLMSEVSDRIRSAMNQEADGADELGVNVRIAAIKTSQAYKEMANGVAWDKLNESMRKTILYHHILEQVSQNLGSTLQDNVQYRLGGFKASLEDVRLALGQAFLPILYTVLPILTSFMRYLERALQYVSAFFRALFGYKVGTSEMLANAEATNAQASAMGGLGDATEDTAEKAKKAAKEIKRGVAGFDEVHLLSETGGASGAGGKEKEGEGAGMPEAPFLQATPTIGWMDNVGEKILELQKKFENFMATSKGFKDLSEGFKMLGGSIDDLYEKSGLKKLMKAIGEDLPQFFDDLAGIGGGSLKVLSGKIDKFTGLIDNDWKKVWEGAGKEAIGTLDIIAGVVGLVFPDAGEKMQEFNDKAEKGFKKFTKEFITDADSIEEAWDDVTNEMKVRFGTKMFEITATAAGKLKELKESMIKNVIEGTKENKKSFEEWKVSASNSMETLKNNSSWIMGVIKQTVKTRMEEAGWEFKNPFTGMGTWFDKNVTQPINKALSNIDARFDGTFGSGLRIVINEVFKKINGFLGSIAGFGIAGKYPFRNITRYAIPPLALAKGGITSGEMIARIGDNPSGHEVVAPLEKLTPMLVEAVRMANQFDGRQGNVGGDIVLNIDGRAFARIIKPHLEREAQRVGQIVNLNPI